MSHFGHSTFWSGMTLIVIGFVFAASLAYLSRGEWPFTFMAWGCILALGLRRDEVRGHKSTLAERN